MSHSHRDALKSAYDKLVAEREQLIDTTNSLAATRRNPIEDRWWYVLLYTVLLSIVAATAGAAAGSYTFALFHGMCSVSDLNAGRCHRSSTP